MKSLLMLFLSLSALNSFGQSPKKTIKQLGSEPIYFIDSVSVAKEDLLKFSPESIASLTVYRDSSALRLAGPKGKDGVIYIETIAFTKRRYWSYFKSKSPEYARLIASPQSDSTVQYILNGRLLKEKSEGDLALIDNKIFKSIKLIDKATLQKEYKVTNKASGVVIESSIPTDLYRAKKKF